MLPAKDTSYELFRKGSRRKAHILAENELHTAVLIGGNPRHDTLTQFGPRNDQDGRAIVSHNNTS